MIPAEALPVLSCYLRKADAASLCLVCRTAHEALSPWLSPPLGTGPCFFCKTSTPWRIYKASTNCCTLCFYKNRAEITCLGLQYHLVKFF